MAPTEPIIGAPLTAAELSDAEALVREAGWNQVAADWEIFRALGTVSRRSRRTARGRNRGDTALRRIRLDQHGAGRRRSNGATASAPELLKRCIAALRRTGPRAGARRHTGRPPALSRARLRGNLGLSPAGASATATPMPEIQPRPTARSFARSPTRTGPHCAPMMPRASVPTAAHCCSGCAGGCRPPNSSPSGTAASPASCSAATGARASQIGPLVAEDDDVAHALLARALPAIDGPVYVDFADSKIGPSRLARGMRIRRHSGRSPACCSAARLASTTRREPSPWSDRSSAETKGPAAIATGPVLRSLNPLSKASAD